MKRGNLLGIFFLILVISIGLVAAQTQNETVEQFKNIITPFLQLLFGGTDYVFEELLFALIIIAFVYMALSKIDAINEITWALWIITISVAILAVRFIATESLVQAILFPQGVLGVALLVGIPFVIYFWFVEFGLEGPRSRVLRKIAWVIWAVVYIFLWIKQFYAPTHQDADWIANLFPIANPSTANLAYVGFGYLYLIIAIASVVLLLADGTIQGAIQKSRARSRLEVHKTKLQVTLMQERHELEEKRTKGIITPAQYTTLDNDLKEREKHAGIKS
jgi:hypothetical protein